MHSYLTVTKFRLNANQDRHDFEAKYIKNGSKTAFFLKNRKPVRKVFRIKTFQKAPILLLFNVFCTPAGTDLIDKSVPDHIGKSGFHGGRADVGQNIANFLF